MLPGTNLTTGQWVRVEGNDPVDCSSHSDDDPFCCTTVTSPNATISLWRAQDLGDQEGFYKCCLPTNCSELNTNMITANIFSKCSHCTSTHCHLLLIYCRMGTD